MPYDTDKTGAMRDLFGLTTIPALIVLVNNDCFNEKLPVITNGRHSLESDNSLQGFPFENGKVGKVVSAKDLQGFPWENGKVGKVVSARDRLIIHGKYGKWWELGHHANPEKANEIYMDEHAVRARARILNIITWLAFMNIFFFHNHTLVRVLFPLMAYEFLMSSTFGLTPLAPVGVLGTILAIILLPEPYWKPARPKRFAWLVGLTLSVLCFTFFSIREQLGDAYKPLVALVVFACNFFTCSSRRVVSV